MVKLCVRWLVGLVGSFGTEHARNVSPHLYAVGCCFRARAAAAPYIYRSPAAAAGAAGAKCKRAVYGVCVF